MANKRNGHLTVATVRWRHLRPLMSRAFWKRERRAGKRAAEAEYEEGGATPDGERNPAAPPAYRNDRRTEP